MLRVATMARRAATVTIDVETCKGCVLCVEVCPPKPDHSQGYVWALYDTYDIFSADSDGKNPVRLTDTKGYDADQGTEAAVGASLPAGLTVTR